MAISTEQILGEQVVVVLVEPQHPGNVGSAARAMKNMGLSRLVLVAPPAWDPETARWMAPGCGDLLASARVVGTLDEALQGTHTAIASTARHRKQGQLVRTPRQAATEIFDRGGSGATTAILFGREDFGLSTADVLRCSTLLRIPTPEHASLNLAQAVLLVSFALFEEATARGAQFEGRTLGGSRTTRKTANASKPSPRDEQADLPQLEPAVEDVLSVLQRVGYLRGVQPDKVRLTARQALATAGLPIRHVEAIRGMTRRIEWALSNPEKDWQKKRSD
jgi:TrmH family RNA methyltransferase